jgi:poly-gamma-glutamate synthesis protein (capsule biosynthesis protein)
VVSVATLLAVGDTAPYVEPPESIFDNVRPLLAGATWRFAQVERTFSDRGTYREDSFGPSTRLSPHLAAAYAAVGFDVVSLATNHALDWGPEALLDTVERFRGMGIRTVGAGPDIGVARQPAILTADGVRVAVLAYCSVLLPQYWATADRPGCAPLRAATYYAPYEYQPGTPARVHTVADPDDLAAMVADVTRAREQADFVVLSCHWGVHFAPRLIPDYEREIAQAAAAAGCDAIVGHGPHMLRGVEVVDGMPCLHSVGNFVMSKPATHRSFAAPEGRYSFADIYSIPVTPTFTYRHHQYGHLGVAARLEFTPGEPVAVSLLPTATDDHPRANVLAPDDPRFDEVVEFLRWSSEPLGGADCLERKDDVIAVRR